MAKPDTLSALLAAVRQLAAKVGLVGKAAGPPPLPKYLPTWGPGDPGASSWKTPGLAAKAAAPPPPPPPPPVPGKAGAAGRGGKGGGIPPVPFWPPVPPTPPSGPGGPGAAGGGGGAAGKSRKWSADDWRKFTGGARAGAVGGKRREPPPASADFADTMAGYGAYAGKTAEKMARAGIPGSGTVGRIGAAASTAGKASKAAAGDKGALGELVGEAVRNTIGRFREMKQGVKDIGAGAAGALKAERVGEAGSSLADSVRGAGKVLGPTGGKFVEKIGDMGKAVFDAVEGFRNLNEQLHKSNMQFAEFSVSMAKVKAEQEVQDILLKQRRGERRAASAEYLAGNRMEMEKRLAVIEDHLAILKNYIVGAFASGFVRVLDFVTAGRLKEEKEAGRFITFTDVLTRSETITLPGRPPGL